MFDWLAGTVAGKMLVTFILSMMPIGELRVGLPYGIALGLEYPLALVAALLGNMIPVPFIIVYIKRIFVWMRRHMPVFDSFITKLESKANLKGETVEKYGPAGLLLFVAIPLPGTGAWTGTLAASILDLDFKKSIISVILGVLLAGIIMTVLSQVVKGGLGLF